MKKFNLILLGSVVLISIVVIINVLTSSDEITISRTGENNLNGISYNINNLEKGMYKIDLFAKEYENGELVGEYNLYSKNIEHKSKNVNLKVGVEDSPENYYIKGLITASLSKELKLSFFENNPTISLLVLEKSKTIVLDKETPIVIYNTDDINENSDISDGYDIGQYEGELIVSMKLSKIQ